jgi:hypothetical protein
MKAYEPFQIVIPIYNDWESAGKLLPLVDEHLARAGVNADVLLVDDGSMLPPPTPWSANYKRVRTVRILTLARNLGHQRAICIALCHLRVESECRQVLVMDGDGEDSPADIPPLLGKLAGADDVRIVFAERTRRSEGPVFTLFYAIYCLLHRLLVGHRVRVGNFSLMNRSCLESLCTSSELWNHYAATAFATRQRIALVPTNRARRLAGQSRMNFTALVMHGLSALSVFADRISTRLLITSAFAVLVTVIAMAIVAIIRLTTGYAIPGWATNAFGILTLLLVQLGAFMFTFSFLTLLTRALSPFIPTRDYQYFVLRAEEVCHGNDP